MVVYWCERVCPTFLLVLVMILAQLRRVVHIPTKRTISVTPLSTSLRTARKWWGGSGVCMLTYCPFWKKKSSVEQMTPVLPLKSLQWVPHTHKHTHKYVCTMHQTCHVCMYVCRPVHDESQTLRVWTCHCLGDRAWWLSSSSACSLLHTTETIMEICVHESSEQQMWSWHTHVRTYNI